MGKTSWRKRPAEESGKRGDKASTARAEDSHGPRQRPRGPRLREAGLGALQASAAALKGAGQLRCKVDSLTPTG